MKLLQWHIKEIATREWIAEDEMHTEHLHNHHCTACALSHLITIFGGDVDLRGLHRYGRCFSFLSVLVRNERERAKQNKTPEEFYS